jgi:hypothetical protein
VVDRSRRQAGNELKPLPRVASIVLRDPTVEACLVELRRNELLRKLVGAESSSFRPLPRALTVSRLALNPIRLVRMVNKMVS